MGVAKPKLSGRVKGFTRQDFLDGKCTADGLALNATPLSQAAANEPEVVEEVVEEEVAEDTPDEEDK